MKEDHAHATLGNIHVNMRDARVARQPCYCTLGHAGSAWDSPRPRPPASGPDLRPLHSPHRKMIFLASSRSMSAIKLSNSLVLPLKHDSKSSSSSSLNGLPSWPAPGNKPSPCPLTGNKSQLRPLVEFEPPSCLLLGIEPPSSLSTWCWPPSCLSPCSRRPSCPSMCCWPPSFSSTCCWRPSCLSPCCRRPSCLSV